MTDERFVATSAAIKTLLEIVIGKELAAPDEIAHLLRGQAQECTEHNLLVSKTILEHWAAFAEDPNRASLRHLLNEPPLGNA